MLITSPYDATINRWLVTSVTGWCVKKHFVSEHDQHQDQQISQLKVRVTNLEAAKSSLGNISAIVLHTFLVWGVAFINKIS